MLYIQRYCAFSNMGIIEPSAPLLNWELAPQPAIVEPDYTAIIPIMQLRRMTKPIKWGVACAKRMEIFTNDSSLFAINVGTAYGLLTDSETFLKQLIQQDEAMLNPTAFIQSTHNTVGGQIALSLKCNAHNMTFVHKGHSFEQALLDIELLTAPAEATFLAGGIDELTDSATKVLQAMDEEQTFVSEGAAFFQLSKVPLPESLACIKAFDFKFLTAEEAFDWLMNFVQDHKDILANDPYVVLDGSEQAIGKRLNGAEHVLYKKCMGNFPTVSAIALSAGVQQLQKYTTVLIINQYHHYWSVYLLVR